MPERCLWLLAILHWLGCRSDSLHCDRDIFAALKDGQYRGWGGLSEIIMRSVLGQAEGRREPEGWWCDQSSLRLPEILLVHTEVAPIGCTTQGKEN